MGFSKKTAKGRLDKYYHLAKEQGYRARSAFKLVQLNKKYSFLNQARVAIDLCAAPGGWLQVAAKFMPMSHVIIGVDLCPIKPISGVITMVNDITTEKCRTDIKKELKDWKADVVMHDGAPNVGNSWVQDAYTQSELVLSSLKLATEFLVEGGWFVTKVFRSKDYNSLMWVFNQLFKKVEATKPSSSRDVSAEIFVVCQGYLAPKHIDPKFLDPKAVFTDVDLLMSASQSSKVNLLHPEKKRRHRDGYEDGQNILFKSVDVVEFIKSTNHVELLASNNRITFYADSEEAKTILSSPEYDEEVKNCCQDLKVLGRKEFKMLIKWRQSMRKLLGIEGKKGDEETVQIEKIEGAEEVNSADELEKLDSSLKKTIKREKRKALERKAKQRLRLQLQMENANDLAMDMQEDGLFSLKGLKKTSKVQEQASEEIVEEGPTESESEQKDDEESEFDSDEDENAAKWEEALEEDYKRFKAEKNLKELKLKELEGYGKSMEEDEDASNQNDDSGASDSDEDNDSLLVDMHKGDEAKAINSSKAALWYSNPLFQSMNQLSEEISKHQQEKKTKSKNRQYQLPPTSTIKEEIDEEMQNESKTKKPKKDSPAKESSGDSSITFVKAEEISADEVDMDEAKEALATAEGITMAAKLASGNRKKARDELIDDTFNRYAFPEKAGDLPSWFVEDESKHNKPIKPITKEAAAAIKLKMKEINERPIKKILEAKGRIKSRALRRLESMKKKAEVIADSDEIGEKSKLIQITKLLKKKPVTKKEMPKLIVAAGSNRGVQGRPKGVKGRYKMVDRRMFKELRAKKRIEKRQKSKGKK